MNPTIAFETCQESISFGLCNSPQPDPMHSSLASGLANPLFEARFMKLKDTEARIPQGGLTYLDPQKTEAPFCLALYRFFSGSGQ